MYTVDIVVQLWDILLLNWKMHCLLSNERISCFCKLTSLGLRHAARQNHQYEDVTLRPKLFSLFLYYFIVNDLLIKCNKKLHASQKDTFCCDIFNIILFIFKIWIIH